MIYPTASQPATVPYRVLEFLPNSAFMLVEACGSSVGFVSALCEALPGFLFDFRHIHDSSILGYPIHGITNNISTIIVYPIYGINMIVQLFFIPYVGYKMIVHVLVIPYMDKR